MARLKDNKDSLRITLAIGFIGIILTSLYIFKQYYINETGFFIDLLKILLNIYGILLSLGFFIFLILKAATLKYSSSNKIDVYKISDKSPDFFYDTSVDNFVWYSEYAIFLILTRYLSNLLIKFMPLSKFWVGLIAVTIVLLCYISLRYGLYWLFKRFKKKFASKHKK